MAFARPSLSNKRRFHVEVDHHGLGVLPRAITIQMPKPPQAGHQIPSLQLRRDHRREFGTSRDSQDRRPSSLVPEMAEGGYSPLQEREKRPSLLTKPTAKAKTVPNCSDRTSLGNGRATTTSVGRRPVANSPCGGVLNPSLSVAILFRRCPNSDCTVIGMISLGGANQLPWLVSTTHLYKVE